MRPPPRPDQRHPVAVDQCLNLFQKTAAAVVVEQGLTLFPMFHDVIQYRFKDGAERISLHSLLHMRLNQFLRLRKHIVFHAAHQRGGVRVVQIERPAVQVHPIRNVPDGNLEKAFFPQKFQQSLFQQPPRSARAAISR